MGKFHSKKKCGYVCDFIYLFIFSSGKKGAAKEYYTLECLLYLLKNVLLQHSVYVRQCAVSFFVFFLFS